MVARKNSFLTEPGSSRGGQFPWPILGRAFFNLDGFFGKVCKSLIKVFSLQFPIIRIISTVALKGQTHCNLWKHQHTGKKLQKHTKQNETFNESWIKHKGNRIKHHKSSKKCKWRDNSYQVSPIMLLTVFLPSQKSYLWNLHSVLRHFSLRQQMRTHWNYIWSLMSGQKM